MTIRIIEDVPEIVLTRSEHDRLQREWQVSQQMTTMPQDFESWVRARRNPSPYTVTLGPPPWKVTAINVGKTAHTDVALEGMRVWG